MEMGFEQEGWLFRESPGWPLAASSARPEWHVLRARLLAAHEAWRSLGTDRSARRTIGYGSFDTGVAARLAAYKPRLEVVNCIGLGTGNRVEDMDAAAAGVRRTDGRGLR